MMQALIRSGFLAALGAAMALSQTPPAKRTVAVANFDYGTVSGNIFQVMGGNVDVGKGIADILVNRLVNGGTYRVIERKEIDRIVAEQNFSNSDRVDPQTAAKLGRILGVDAIIIGSITQFGRDDRDTNTGGLGGRLGGFGGGGLGFRKARAVVEINARMINVDTAEILAVAAGKGTAERSGTSITGLGAGTGGWGAGGVDMGSKNFGATILGEAVNKAVTQIAAELEASAAKLPARAVNVDGLIADVSGNTLVINVGSRAGVTVGMRLEVRQVGREIRDPATGRVIRRLDTLLGTMTVTEVDATSAVGTFEGSGTPKAGDRVKTPATPQ
jgi:curli biogenesis system outer membrane secretion channel CsgG